MNYFVTLQTQKTFTSSQFSKTKTFAIHMAFFIFHSFFTFHFSLSTFHLKQCHTIGS